MVLRMSFYCILHYLPIAVPDLRTVLALALPLAVSTALPLAASTALPLAVSTALPLAVSLVLPLAVSLALPLVALFGLPLAISLTPSSQLPRAYSFLPQPSLLIYTFSSCLLPFVLYTL